MNQRIMIYIILSAILLYLYYKKQDITIFAAFIVLVSSTLIFGKDVREGAKNKGGSGGIDKECTKMGFKEPKIDKDDPEGSIEKIFKNIKTVADKYWPYDSNTPKEEKVSLDMFFKEFQKEVSDTIPDKETKKLDMFVLTAADSYEKKKTKELLEQKPTDISLIISGGELTLKVLKSVSKSTKTDSEFKERLKYLICLCKLWITIFKEIKKANGSGGGGGGDDEEEKPKKKKNAKKAKKEEDDGDDEDKPKKKAKKEEDEEGGDGEEEKPKKKAKAKAKAKKEEEEEE